MDRPSDETLEEVRAFLEAIGCESVDDYVSDSGWVDCTCPFAEWNHSGGVDSDPSFGVHVGGLDGDEPLGFSCWSCEESGATASYLLTRMRKMSGRSYERAKSIIDQADWAESSSGKNTGRFGYASELEDDDQGGGGDVDVGGGSSGFTFDLSPSSGTAFSTLDSTDESADRDVDPEDVDYRDPMPESALDHAEYRFHDYMLERGFDRETMKAWDIQVAKHEVTGYERIVFPVRNLEGDLLAYTRRVTWDAPKCQNCGYTGPDPDEDWRYSPEEWEALQVSFGTNSCPECGRWVWPKYLHSKGFNRNLYLYGEHLVDPDSSTCVLVEGTTDAPWMYQHGVRNVLATMGSKPGTRRPDPEDGEPGHQLWRLGRLFDEIVLVPDGDEAGGGWADTIEEYYAGREHVAWVNVRRCPDGKDPGDLSPDEIDEVLEGLPVWGVPF